MYERNVPRKHLQSEKIEAVREEVEEEYNISLPPGKNEEFYENHDLVRKQERFPAWKEIEKEIKDTKETYFLSPLLDEIYNEAVKSLSNQNPRKVVERTNERVDEFKEHIEFFRGLQKDLPEYFPDRIDFNFNDLQHFESMEGLKNFRGDFQRQVITFLMEPDVEKVEIPVHPREGGVSWEINPTVGEGSYTPKITNFLEYLSQNKY